MSPFGSEIHVVIFQALKEMCTNFYDKMMETKGKMDKRELSEVTRLCPKLLPFYSQTLFSKSSPSHSSILLVSVSEKSLGWLPFIQLFSWSSVVTVNQFYTLFSFIRTHLIRTVRLRFASIWRGNSRTGPSLESLTCWK